jgi:hypothetical protein
MKSYFLPISLILALAPLAADELQSPQPWTEEVTPASQPVVLPVDDGAVAPEAAEWEAAGFSEVYGENYELTLIDRLMGEPYSLRLESKKKKAEEETPASSWVAAATEEAQVGATAGSMVAVLVPEPQTYLILGAFLSLAFFISRARPEPV